MQEYSHYIIAGDQQYCSHVLFITLLRLISSYILEHSDLVVYDMSRFCENYQAEDIDLLSRLQRFFSDIEVYQGKGFASFFDDYARQIIQVQAALAKSLAGRLANLFNGMLQIRLSYEEQNKLLAVDYNVFTIIGRSRAYPDGYSRKEVLTHSPFLSDLLDPTSAHGQQDLFFKEFIASLTGLPEHKRNYFLNVCPNDYSVTKEWHSIDIFIRSFKPSNQFAVIIENKINDAPDQERQLERYYDEIHKIKAFDKSDEKIILIYLTLDGRKPSNYSLDREICERLIDKRVLFCLSADNVAQLLTHCIHIVKNDKVRLIVRQYIDILGRMYA